MIDHANTLFYTSTSGRGIYKIPSDAGYDLYGDPAVEGAMDVLIYPSEIRKFDTGIRVSIPRGNVGFIKERSGYPYRGVTIAVRGGVIDSEYSGNIIVMLQNTGDDVVKLDLTRALAQLVVLKLAEINTLQLSRKDFDKATSHYERGEDGFGSTDVDYSNVKPYEFVPKELADALAEIGERDYVEAAS